MTMDGFEWTDAHVAMLTRAVPNGKTPRELAKRLGTTPDVVRAKIKELNISRAWSTEKTERLVQLWGEGLSCSDVAEKMGLCPVAVATKASVMKLPPAKNIRERALIINVISAFVGTDKSPTRMELAIASGVLEHNVRTVVDGMEADGALFVNRTSPGRPTRYSLDGEHWTGATDNGLGRDKEPGPCSSNIKWPTYQDVPLRIVRGRTD